MDNSRLSETRGASAHESLSENQSPLSAKTGTPKSASRLKRISNIVGTLKPSFLRSPKFAYLDKNNNGFGLNGREEAAAGALTPSRKIPAKYRQNGQDAATVVENQTSPTAIHPSKLIEYFQNPAFFDATLVASDDTEFNTYRCILAAFSPVFAKLFKKNKELPVQIKLPKVDAATIQSALDFMYGKPNAIAGNESLLIKFATEQNIRDLLVACCKSAEARIDATNVCEFIQIAYDGSVAYEEEFKELKEKCLQTLHDKKQEIDSSKFAKLPENIRFDFFERFKNY